LLNIVKWQNCEQSAGVAQPVERVALMKPQGVSSPSPNTDLVTNSISAGSRSVTLSPSNTILIVPQSRLRLNSDEIFFFFLSLFWWDRSSGELTPVPLEGTDLLGHRQGCTFPNSIHKKPYFSIL
jgi:hypothetical protein